MLLRCLLLAFTAALALTGCQELQGTPTAAAPAQTSGYCAAPAGMTAVADTVPKSEDSQLPWRRTPGTQKTRINIVAPSATAEWRGYLEYGARAWSKSPCLDVRIVTACPAGGNCVSFRVASSDADGNFNADESGGYTVGGDIDVNPNLSAAERKNVTVHEIGHAVGLAHRRTEGVLMNSDTYSDVFDPDATDYRNLLFLYGRQK